MKNDNTSTLAISYRPVATLVVNPNNARMHSKHQVAQIGTSIREFGFINPVVIDCNDTIIAGHARVAAAKLLDMALVPTIRVENLTEDQVRAYMLADNKLAENADWNKQILSIEFEHLLKVDGNLDIAVTGFEISEIDIVLEEARDKEQDKDDVFQIDETSQAVTQSGDLWKLGRHRILCGNSLHDASLRILMVRRHADLVFIDPPFNVPIDGHVSGNGSVRHREFVMASGEMNEAEYIAFLTTTLRLLARYSTPDSLQYICMDWRHIGELLAAGRQIYDALLNVCVWVKNNGGMGSFYRSRHELIFVFRNGKGRHRNNIQLGKYGRNRTNVWEYPSVNTISRKSDEGNLLALHPTVKPVALVADALLDCSARGDIVLDTFLGSGATLIAAERVGRICLGMEIDPRYVDVAIRRWQRHTGDHAVQEATGKSFDDIAGALEVSRGE